MNFWGNRYPRARPHHWQISIQAQRQAKFYQRARLGTRDEHLNKYLCFASDPATDKIKADSGIGCAWGDFNTQLIQPKEKGQEKRISEVKNAISTNIHVNLLYGNEDSIIILQLGRDWWWQWTEEERTKELTVLGWSRMNNKEKKDWKRYNKELWLLMEPLCKGLTWMEAERQRTLWIGVVAKHIKEFKKTIIYHETLPLYIKHMIETTNRNIADALTLVCMLYSGQLDGYLEAKKQMGWLNYYHYYFNNREKKK